LRFGLLRILFFGIDYDLIFSVSPSLVLSIGVAFIFISSVLSSISTVILREIGLTVVVLPSISLEAISMFRNMKSSNN